jgi:manganese efflux pump family protein
MNDMLRTGAVAIAIGLDVFALSIAVGIKGLPWPSRLRLGAAFAFSEIFMQIAGYVLGTFFGRIIGDVAAWIGLVVLAGIGAWILYESFKTGDEHEFDVEKPVGLLLASISISLDSLGVGFALPSLHLPIPALFATVACTTVAFTLAGLAFGSKLGELYEEYAERGAGTVLILLAIAFAIEKIRGG